MNDKKHTWTIDHESKLTDPVVNEGSITGVSYSEENYKKARDAVPFTITDGEKYLSLFRKGADWAREYTKKEYEEKIKEIETSNFLERSMDASKIATLTGIKDLYEAEIQAQAKKIESITAQIAIAVEALKDIKEHSGEELFYGDKWLNYANDVASEALENMTNHKNTKNERIEG